MQITFFDFIYSLGKSYKIYNLCYFVKKNITQINIFLFYCYFLVYLYAHMCFPALIFDSGEYSFLYSQPDEDFLERNYQKSGMILLKEMKKHPE